MAQKFESNSKVILKEFKNIKDGFITKGSVGTITAYNEKKNNYKVLFTSLGGDVEVTLEENEMEIYIPKEKMTKIDKIVAGVSIVIIVIVALLVILSLFIDDGHATRVMLFSSFVILIAYLIILVAALIKGYRFKRK